MSWESNVFCKISSCALSLHDLSIVIYHPMPYWTSPIVTRKKTRDATNPHQHLKFVEIVGYYGRSSDFELAVFILHTAVALKRIVIDTRGKQDMWNAAAKVFSKNKESARSSIEQQLVPLLPQGAELVTLFSE